MAAVSEAHATAARENGKHGGRPLKRLSEIPCTCADVRNRERMVIWVPEHPHAADCPRGCAIWRRLDKGQELVW